MADEVFDTLGQFPAPEVKVLVQVVSVCIGDSCLVSVRKYIKSLIICYLLLSSPTCGARHWQRLGTKVYFDRFPGSEQYFSREGSFVLTAWRVL